MTPTVEAALSDVCRPDLPLHARVKARDVLRTEIERLTQALKVANLKNQHSLANNLCPDHRDKQKGKLCLACEIERLEAEREQWERTVVIMDKSIREYETR